MSVNDKILTMLGFAAKAGRLSYGANASLEAVAGKKSKVILICCDVSEKSKKEMVFQCKKNGLKPVILHGYDMKTVSDAVGRSCGVISVNDASFAEQIIKLVSVIKGGNAND